MTVQEAVSEQIKTLLDTQLANLAQRLFEVGKKADQQLTAWLTFAALTVLLCLGVSGKVTFGGLDLKPTVAAAVTFGLSCGFYYRATLSMEALRIWRAWLRDRREQRFAVLLEAARAAGEKVERDTKLEIHGGVSEYPGYIACIVLIKDMAVKQGGPPGLLVPLIHKSVVVVFGLSPYVLAGMLIYATNYALPYIVISVLGIVMCLAANVMLNLRTEPVLQRLALS